MEATELRIGNIIMDSLTGAFLKVTDISEFSYKTKVIDRSKFPLPKGWQTSPILLTEEVLKRCGFEKCVHGKHGDYQILMGKGTNSDGLFLIIDLQEYSVVIGQLEYFSHCFSETKYLHQLQNLYFALTGEELIIK